MATEVEAKFHVIHLAQIAVRLEALGAELVHPRVHERNWRCDTPDRALEAAWEILRLRASHQILLTYKGRTEVVDGTSQRPEYEIEVNDLENTRQLLSALGFEISGFYEKYRTEYHLVDLVITLDELPFGDFVEIEGANVSDIQNLAADLGLNWEANLTENYLVLFTRMKRVLNLEIEDVSFEALAGVEATPEMWGITPADR